MSTKAYLTEAFKKLNILDEDVFDVDDDGIEKLSDFKKADEVEDTIDVIDPNASDESEIEDSYVGKVIIDCCVCHSKIYKDKGEITIDEESELVNVGEECPFCYSVDGYKVIGEVAEYKAEDEKEEVKVDADDEDGKDVEVKVDVDEKNESLKAIRSKAIAEVLKKKKHIVKEGIEGMTIDTGDQEINVTVEEKTEDVEIDDEKDENAEMIVPTTDEVRDDIEANSEVDDDIDVDVDDFDEDEFDELGESYLKKVYNNVESYKTTKVTTDDRRMKVEGLIKFKSGKSKKTNFVFESKDITKSGKARFVGENLQISRGRKSFALTGRIDNNKFIAESLNYNYTAKDGKTGNSTKVYGTVRKSK